MYLTAVVSSFLNLNIGQSDVSLMDAIHPKIRVCFYLNIYFEGNLFVISLIAFIKTLQLFLKICNKIVLSFLLFYSLLEGI